MLCADVPREQESDRDLLWGEARARKRDLLVGDRPPRRRQPRMRKRAAGRRENV